MEERNRVMAGGKHSRALSDSPTEKDAKQAKASDSPTEKDKTNSTLPEKPSEREIKAALAARERLYGEGTGPKATEAVPPSLPTGPEPEAKIEVEYPSTDALQPVEDAASSLDEAVTGMASSDWQVAMPALVLLRRLTVHHSQEAWTRIEEIAPLVLKAVKSLRSSLCKTAIMCAADLVRTFKADMEPYLNKGGVSKPAASLLHQLLLKASSSDKRFVVDEAKTALSTMAESIPSTLFSHVLPYAEHKSPKVRGAAAFVLLACAEKLEPEDWQELGVERVLGVASNQVTDKTPDTRDAARKLLGLLRTVHAQQLAEKENAQEPLSPSRAGNNAKPLEENRGTAAELAPTWEAHCQQCLGPAKAIAVLKATATDIAQQPSSTVLASS